MLVAEYFNFWELECESNGGVPSPFPIIPYTPPCPWGMNSTSSEKWGIMQGQLNAINGIACVFWAACTVAALYKAKIPFNRSIGRVNLHWVERDKSPTSYWTLIALMAVITVWTGVAYVQRR